MGRKRAGHVKLWTIYQDDFLREFWGELSVAELAATLNREDDAVQQRAYHLGLEGQHKNPSRS